MLKIVNKKHYDNLVREITNLAIESKNRELELAKLEHVVEYLKDNYDSVVKENISLRQALEYREYREYEKRNKKKEEVKIETKSFDKDAYIKECIKMF